MLQVQGCTLSLERYNICLFGNYQRRLLQHFQGQLHTATLLNKTAKNTHTFCKNVCIYLNERLPRVMKVSIPTLRILPHVQVIGFDGDAQFQAVRIPI